MMNCETYRGLVAAHIDGVLTPRECQEAEQHVGSCLSCQHLFRQAARFRAAWVLRRPLVSVPLEVEQRLRLALSATGVSCSPVWQRLGDWFRAGPLLPRVALGVATAGMLAALLLPRLSSTMPKSTLLARAAAYSQAAKEGKLAVAYLTADPQGLETTLNRSGQLDFVTHVIDFRPAGYVLKGGKVERVQGRAMAVALYEGEEGQIVCLRQRGSLPFLSRRTQRFKRSRLYTYAGHTILLAQFSDHFCILAANLSREAFLRRLAMLPASSVEVGPEGSRE